MLIKVLSFISLLPSFLILSKIKKTRDLSCIDIFVLFMEIYVAVIPLIFDSKDISLKIIINNDIIPIYVFIVFNSFIWFLLILNNICFRYLRGNYLFNITRGINTWSSRYEFSYKFFYFCLVLQVIQWYTIYGGYQNSMEIGVHDLATMRELQRASNSPINMWISSSQHILRLYSIFLLTIFFLHKSFKCKPKKYKILAYCCAVSQLLVQLQISRTYIVESLFFILIIMYSCNRNIVTLKNIAKGASVLIVIVVLVFPLITAYRFAKYYMIGNSNNTDIITFVTTGVGMVANGDIDIKDADNSSERVWNVYSILAYTYEIEYEGNGELTVNAFSYGVPSFIYPNKSKLGSQGIIERESKLHLDVADSLLLLGMLENRIFGPILAIIYCIIIFISFNFILTLFRRFFISIYPLVLSTFYIWTNEIEMTFDGFLPRLIQLLMWILFVLFLNYLVFKNKVFLRL